jgi:uncharacterized repeat protein (TIGR01451 family)
MNLQTCTTSGAGLERVRYFSRQLITADDMLTEQQYFRQKLRRHNRFLHGWGVVCGLEVLTAASDTYPWQVIVGAGYALGPYGDEIYVAESRCFNIAECITSIMNPCDPTAKPTPVLPKNLYLAIRYTECETRPMRVHPLGCACDETLCEYSRIRDDFELACVPDKPDPPVMTCKICDDRFLVDSCPPCPDSPWVVLAKITFPTPTSAQPDVMKINLVETNIDNFARRQIFSTTTLQEQLIACCCKPSDLIPLDLKTDLMVTKDGSVAGQILTYTITVTNNGPVRALGVIVTDTLPDGLTAAKGSSTRWSPSGGHIVTANLGDMDVHKSVSLKLIAVGVQSTEYTNTVEVKSNTPESDASNNKASKTLSTEQEPPR